MNDNKPDRQFFDEVFKNIGKYDTSKFPKIDWEKVKEQIKQFDRNKFKIGDLSLSHYQFPSNISTSLDDYYKQIVQFYCEVCKLIICVEGSIYKEGYADRNSLSEMKNIIAASFTADYAGKFKSIVGEDVFKCRLIQHSISEINRGKHLSLYEEEIKDISPNELYDYNSSFIRAIETFAKIFAIPKNIYNYISEKFEDLIVGNIPFFDDLKLVCDSPKLLGILTIIDRLKEINKQIIETGCFKNEVEKQLAEMKKEGNTIEPKTNVVNTKLKWLGTPAQFGFIIQELIGKGYLEKPTGSFAKDANVYLQLFDIQTKPATLAKEISTGENQNSLSSTNRAKIKIAHKDQLK